jgi:hypothetical protein
MADTHDVRFAAKGDIEFSGISALCAEAIRMIAELLSF